MCLAEIVEEGISGFLTEYNDDKTFSKYILKLLIDETLRKQMGDRGRQIVKEKFNIQQMVEGFVNVYDEYFVD